MTSFPAYLATKTDEGQTISKTELGIDDLMEGDVTVRVEYSALNYKDGLAMTNSAPIIRKYPLVPGIDFAGTVVESTHDRFNTGDRVVLNGFGVGESHSGGFAGMARVNGDWLVPLPDTISTRQAMAIGTAGYTAMLCILALEHHGIVPADGPVLVTGAAGGVGSVAVAILNQLGHKVTATTGRPQESDYLESLGASEVIDRKPFAEKAKPLAKELWSGAVDVAGGNTLANVLSQTKRGGAVAACGLAESMDLPTSVAPFILRGVTLYGIDSVMCPMEKRLIAWQRLDTDLDKQLLESLSTEILFDDLPEASSAILKGQIRGRTIVKIPQ
ncbi:MAG: oxidoreductase [Thiotrichales bacterium]|nr:MAG: oxidoreductase [Thiotrichales bacterium]